LKSLPPSQKEHEQKQTKNTDCSTSKYGFVLVRPFQLSLGIDSLQGSFLLVLDEADVEKRIIDAIPLHPS
jgi:hypothetical protein